MAEIQVLSRTQRIVVDRVQRIEVNPDRSVSVVGFNQGVVVQNAGGVGPPGIYQDPTPQIDAAIAEHVSDPTPHPAYDDMQDLVILFENGLY